MEPSIWEIHFLRKICGFLCISLSFQRKDASLKLKIWTLRFCLKFARFWICSWDSKTYWARSCEWQLWSRGSCSSKRIEWNSIFFFRFFHSRASIAKFVGNQRSLWISSQHFANERSEMLTFFWDMTIFLNKTFPKALFTIIGRTKKNGKMLKMWFYSKFE